MKSTANREPRKRPFNLLLNQGTVRQARDFTDNLSATVELLLADYVAKQNEALLSRQQLGDAVAEAWNQFHATHAPFADDYSPL